MENIKELEKERIANKLVEFMTKRRLSQTQAGVKVGVSNAYINKMVNGLPPESREKWDSISDNTWRSVLNQINSMTGNIDSSNAGDWVVLDDLGPFEDLKKILTEAKKYSQTLGIIAPPGTGKTAVGKLCTEWPNFYHIKCSVIQNVNSFMRTILKEMALNSHGMTQTEMMQLIKDTLRGQEKPMLYMDEFDKVPESVVKFFIDLFNGVEGECSLVIAATNFLQRRIQNGLIKDKQGYPELYSRLGGEWMKINSPDSLDVGRVVAANGIDNEVIIQQIVNKAQGDLRKVKFLVFKEKRKQEELAKQAA